MNIVKVKKIQEVNTENTALIIAQNQELVQYTNKLKLQLAKSYTAIQKVEKLQKENIALKNTNAKLEQENHKLKNYIERTFEVVNHLFSFPIDRFKRIVDNFIRSLEK